MAIDLVAVGEAGGIHQVMKMGIGELFTDLTKYRQTTGARVKNQNAVISGSVRRGGNH